MLITKIINTFVNGKMLKYYNELNYNISANGYCDIHINDLPKNSHKIVKCICDNCNGETSIKYYNYYQNIIKNNGKYFCTNCKIERTTSTNIKKYGVKSTLKLDNTKNKIKKTMMDRYQVEYAMQNEEIKNKTKNTNIEKYGVTCSLLNEDIKTKTKNTILNKYGVDHYSKSIDYKDKIISNMIDNHNVTHYSKTQKFKEQIDKSTIKRNLDNKNIEILSIDNREYTIECDLYNGHNFKIDKDLFKTRLKYKTIICTKCNKINSFSKSGQEIKLLEFIKNNYDGEIIENTKNIISPYEIDIYLPKLNLAFEYNGLYWHNELNKSNNYHLQKTEMCENINIQLIHIYEDDWLNKEDIVKSMILNKLKKNNIRIFARKTEIREITDNKLIKTFLIKNHLQGFVGSQIKLGLFYKNELVSLMTFGKLRKPMNSKSTNNEYEMLRFCNKLNTNVIGGSSKLFKYFISMNNVSSVISYANRSHSNGNLYNQLGFSLLHKTVPNYYYIINNIRKYRFGFRKDILVKNGFDKNKSEHQIMIDRKIYRIYDSGNLKYYFYI